MNNKKVRPYVLIAHSTCIVEWSGLWNYWMGWD